MPATLDEIAISASLAAQYSQGVVQLQRLVEKLAADVAEIKAQLEST